MERHNAGSARVIPVIVRPCEWHHAAFGRLKALPQDGKPIYGGPWKNADAGFANVANGLRQVVTELTVLHNNATAPKQLHSDLAVVPTEYAVEVSYREVQDIRLPENAIWPEPLIYPAVFIANAGTKSINIYKVTLRWSSASDDGIPTAYRFDLDCDDKRALMPRKPINQEDISDWKREYLLISSERISTLHTVQSAAQADIASFRLEIWVEENQDEPIFIKEGIDLAFLHSIIQKHWKSLARLESRH